MKNNDQKSHAEDEAIHDILKKIFNKWSEEINEDHPVTETIILSPGSLRKETAFPKEETDVSEKTVIISTKEQLKTTDPEPELRSKEEEEVPPETAIISINTKDVKTKEPEGPSDEKKKKKKGEAEDFLGETVILKPEDIQKKGKDETE
jgi:hypothetical protein